MVDYLAAGATGTWSDQCLAWPENAKAAFSYAADQWSTVVTATVPIHIEACWSQLGTNVLGHGGAVTIQRNFTGAPQSDTWYPIALANAVRGFDLNGSTAEIAIAYNSVGIDWYFGLDGNPGGSQSDFVSVVMHEIAHGLGFSGTMTVGTDGRGAWGNSGIAASYDRFAVNGSGQYLIDTAAFPNPSTALAAQLTSGNVYFNGTRARAANNGQLVKLYTPSTWRQGSSFAHLDYDTYHGTPNTLMVWALTVGSSIHQVGPIIRALLEDTGWWATASARHYTRLPLVARWPTPTPTVGPPGSGPKPGFWASQTADEFYVTPNGQGMTKFAIYVKLTTGSCAGSTYKITLTSPSVVAISNNQFSFSGGFYGTGTFDSTTSAHGTDGLDRVTIASCGTLTGGPWNWTATWQNSSQPSASGPAGAAGLTVEPASTAGQEVHSVVPDD